MLVYNSPEGKMIEKLADNERRLFCQAMNRTVVKETIMNIEEHRSKYRNRRIKRALNSAYFNRKLNALFKDGSID